MDKVEELRRTANQARRAARLRTEGGQAADRQLIALADRLERQADEIASRLSVAGSAREWLPSR